MDDPLCVHGASATLQNPVSISTAQLLYISTSKQVLHILFADQIFFALNRFFHLFPSQMEKRGENAKYDRKNMCKKMTYNLFPLFISLCKSSLIAQGEECSHLYLQTTNSLNYCLISGLKIFKDVVGRKFEFVKLLT